MKNIDILSELPILDISNHLFMGIDNDLSDDKIKKLIEKNIIFKLTDDATDFGLLGTLEDYKGSQLFIRHFLGEMLVFELYEIFGLEEFTLNSIIDISNEYIGSICEITNYKNDSIVCLVTNVIHDEVVFKVKISNDDFFTIYYPKDLVKSIKKIS